MTQIREVRKPIILLLAFMIIFIFQLTKAYAMSLWTQQQDTAHEIAELARSLDLPEDNPIILEAQRLWYEDYAIVDEQSTNTVYSDTDAVIIAKILFRECGGIQSDTEKACIAWVILNRVDAGYGDTIEKVGTAPAQFGYNASLPVKDNLLNLSYDVLERWAREKNNETDVGRVLPKDYLWYCGDGVHNYFRNAYTGGTKWDYSMASPYMN